MNRIFLLSSLLFLTTAATAAEPTYVKKATRVETIAASLKAAGLPTLEGDWHYIGPFDNAGIDAAAPPEKEIDLTKTYAGKDGQTVAWTKFKSFPIGSIVDLKRFKQSDNCVVYLYHEIDVDKATTLPISLGSDDFIKVWLNGEQLVSDDAVRPAAPDQDQATLKLKPGKNQLLLKVGNIAGGWEVYVVPELPLSWPAKVRDRLARDFPTPAPRRPRRQQCRGGPLPHRHVAGPQGLRHGSRRPGHAGRRQAAGLHRRGEVWLIDKPNADDPADVKFKLYASGLHEALGLNVSGKDVYVVQRPELTKLVDTKGDDVVDEYDTICDKWGVSGDYHEFAFGPARDKDGNFFVTLNVGFGGGHQSKAPWRGWCVKISPNGDLKPWAVGFARPTASTSAPTAICFMWTTRANGWRLVPCTRSAKGSFTATPPGCVG